MFIGHTAVALAAKGQAPRVNLGILLVAATWLDLLFPLFCALGLESLRIEPGNTAFVPMALDNYPWSHSLLLTVVWGALLGLGYWLWRRDRRAALVLAALVGSHWLLDVLSHRPDMPLWPGSSPKLGLGLWQSIPLTFLVEGALFAAGLALYLRATRATRWQGHVALWSLVALLVVIWVIGPFSPPPPSTAAATSVGFASWLLPLWAAWADRNRSSTSPLP
jgi:membrane-bound metal-dependent hydrolase YbcI (DUF457 family)